MTPFIKGGKVGLFGGAGGQDRAQRAFTVT